MKNLQLIYQRTLIISRLLDQLLMEGMDLYQLETQNQPLTMAKSASVANRATCV